MSKNHEKVIGQFFETNDYSKFKLHINNRVIKPNHVLKLTKKMKLNGWLKTSMIVVNEKFQIIDGHHRLLAAVESGVPLRYHIVKGATTKDIVELNTTQLKWSPFDHINIHVKKGNKNYINLVNFINDYPQYKITECSMFCRNSFSSVDRTAFEEGRWECKNMATAREWADNILELKPFFPGYNKSIFVRTMIKIFSNKPEFNFQSFMHKVNLRPGMIHLCGSVELYTQMVEEIYNYRRNNNDKINLRF
jgi:hypothetical protein